MEESQGRMKAFLLYVLGTVIGGLAVGAGLAVLLGRI